VEEKKEVAKIKRLQGERDAFFFPLLFFCMIPLLQFDPQGASIIHTTHSDNKNSNNRKKESWGVGIQLNWREREREGEEKFAVNNTRVITSRE